MLSCSRRYHWNISRPSSCFKFPVIHQKTFLLVSGSQYRICSPLALWSAERVLSFPGWLQGGSKVASWWLFGGSKVAPIWVNSNAAALGAVVPRSYATDGQRSVDDRTGWPGDHVVLVNSQDVVGGAGLWGCHDISKLLWGKWHFETHTLVRKVHDLGSGHFQTYSGVEEKMADNKSTTEQNLNVLGSSEGKLFVCLTETSWMF